MKKYMAYNHNDTPLMKEPGAKREAEAEAAKYRNATANPAYVREVDDEPTKEEVKEQYPWRAALLSCTCRTRKLLTRPTVTRSFGPTCRLHNKLCKLLMRP